MSEKLPLSEQAPEPLGRRTFDLRSGPLRLGLGYDVDNYDDLLIMYPWRDADLLPDIDLQNIETDCMIVQPSAFNMQQRLGYLILHDGDQRSIGHRHNIGIFDFTDQVADTQFFVSRRGDYLLLEDKTQGDTFVLNPTEVRTAPLNAEETPPEGTYINPAELAERHIMHAESLASAAHPDRNEDSYLILPHKKTFAVFDGMGGHAGSDLAAQVAANSIEQSLRHGAYFMNKDVAMEIVYGALKTANQEVLRVSAGRKIGTTAAVVKEFEYYDGESPQSTSKYCVVAHVGDSRIYIARKAKGYTLEYTTLDQVRRVTDDPRREQHELASIKSRADFGRMPQVLQKRWMHRNEISYFIGMPDNELKISMHTIRVNPGDIIFGTTDGIHDNLTFYEMQRIVARHSTDVLELQHHLIRAAYGRSVRSELRSKPDDMTVVTYVVD